MKKNLYGIFTALIFVAGANLQAHAQDISGSVGAVKRGGSVRGSIVMNVPNNLHVNSNSPNSEYAIPTTVKISAVGAKVGAVGYPRGNSRKFAFSEDSLNVYEGRNVFSFNLSVPAKFKGSQVKLRVAVRYQACTNEVCYPPKTKEITLTAPVK